MREQIREVMADVFGIATADIPDDPTVDTLTAWASLRHIELMMALEMEFGVSISMSAMLELLSLEAIEGYLAEQMTRRP